MSKKKSFAILSVIILITSICETAEAKSVYATTDLIDAGTSGPYGMRAGQLRYANIANRDVGVIHAASMREVSTTLAYSSYIFTTEDIVLFSYEDGTRVEVYDSDGNPVPVEPNVLDKGEHAYVNTSTGVYIVAGSNKFAVLTGDATTNGVSGYYAMDADGRGASKEFYTYVPYLYGHCEFIVFAYENGTTVTVQEEVANGVYVDIASFSLDKGKHWANSGLSAKYLHITADRLVSALTSYDQSYFVPSANGTWSGTGFYTYLSDIAGWPEDLTVIAYNDDTFVSVKDSDTQELIWEGTLDSGKAHVESYPGGANRYFTITSGKPVTVSVQPWIACTSDYYQGVFIPDIGGTGVGTDLIGSTLNGGYLYILAHLDNTRADVYDANSGAWQASYTLNMGQAVNANPGNGLWRIISNRDISAHSGCGYAATADFAPLAFNKGPLTLEKVDDVNDGDCVVPDANITYTIDYNYPCVEGNCPDINDVNIIDELPEGVDFMSSEPGPNEIIDCNKIIWKIGTLRPGDANRITLKVRVKCVEPGSTITNYCEIKSGDRVLKSAYEETSICANYLVVEDFERYANTAAMRKCVESPHEYDECKSCERYPVWSNSQWCCRRWQLIITTLHRRNMQMPVLLPLGQIVLDLAPTGDYKDVKALSLWFHGIGVPDFRGSYTGSDPYTLNGDGSGIDNTKYDVFYFVYTEKTPTAVTGQVEARVVSIENTDPSAMAGVMIRDSLDPCSVFAATVVTPDKRCFLIARTNTTPTSAAIGTVSGITMPHWVRIQRTGTPYGVYRQACK